MTAIQTVISIFFKPNDCAYIDDSIGNYCESCSPCFVELSVYKGCGGGQKTPIRVDVGLNNPETNHGDDRMCEILSRTHEYDRIPEVHPICELFDVDGRASYITLQYDNDWPEFDVCHSEDFSYDFFGCQQSDGVCSERSVGPGDPGGVPKTSGEFGSSNLWCPLRSDPDCDAIEVRTCRVLLYRWWERTQVYDPITGGYVNSTSSTMFPEWLECGARGHSRTHVTISPSSQFDEYARCNRRQGRGSGSSGSYEMRPAGAPCRDNRQCEDWFPIERRAPYPAGTGTGTGGCVNTFLSRNYGRYDKVLINQKTCCRNVRGGSCRDGHEGERCKTNSNCGTQDGVALFCNREFGYNNARCEKPRAKGEQCRLGDYVFAGMDSYCSPGLKCLAPAGGGYVCCESEGDDGRCADAANAPGAYEAVAPYLPCSEIAVGDPSKHLFAPRQCSDGQNACGRMFDRSDFPYELDTDDNPYVFSAGGELRIVQKAAWGLMTANPPTRRFRGTYVDRYALVCCDGNVLQDGKCVQRPLGAPCKRDDECASGTCDTSTSWDSSEVWANNPAFTNFSFVARSHIASLYGTCAAAATMDVASKAMTGAPCARLNHASGDMTCGLGRRCGRVDTNNMYEAQQSYVDVVDGPDAITTLVPTDMKSLCCGGGTLENGECSAQVPGSFCTKDRHCMGMCAVRKIRAANIFPSVFALNSRIKFPRVCSKYSKTDRADRTCPDGQTAITTEDDCKAVGEDLGVSIQSASYPNRPPGCSVSGGRQIKVTWNMGNPIRPNYKKWKPVCRLASSPPLDFVTSDTALDVPATQTSVGRVYGGAFVLSFGLTDTLDMRTAIGVADQEVITVRNDANNRTLLRVAVQRSAVATSPHLLNASYFPNPFAPRTEVSVPVADRGTEGTYKVSVRVRSDGEAVLAMVRDDLVGEAPVTAVVQYRERSDSLEYRFNMPHELYVGGEGAQHLKLRAVQYRNRDAHRASDGPSFRFDFEEYVRIVTTLGCVREEDETAARVLPNSQKNKKNFFGLLGRLRGRSAFPFRVALSSLAPLSSPFSTAEKKIVPLPDNCLPVAVGRFQAACRARARSSSRCCAGARRTPSSRRPRASRGPRRRPPPRRRPCIRSRGASRARWSIASWALLRVRAAPPGTVAVAPRARRRRRDHDPRGGPRAGYTEVPPSDVPDDASSGHGRASTIPWSTR